MGTFWYRTLWTGLPTKVQDLDNQIALLHASIAALGKDKAALTLAQIDFNRAK